MLRLLGRLEQEEIVVTTGDLDVGADPAGGGEQHRATRPPRLQPVDVGREQVAEPADGVAAADLDLAPGGPIEERTFLFERQDLALGHLIHAGSHPLGVLRAPLGLSARWKFRPPSSSRTTSRRAWEASNGRSRHWCGPCPGTGWACSAPPRTALPSTTRRPRSRSSASR